MQGEEGIDEGGVQKEFFQLIVRQMFDLNYGMFTHDEVSLLQYPYPSKCNISTHVPAPIKNKYRTSDFCLNRGGIHRF